MSLNCEIDSDHDVVAPTNVRTNNSDSSATLTDDASAGRQTESPNELRKLQQQRIRTEVAAFLNQPPLEKVGNRINCSSLLV
jgi:hypothetical protein